MKSATRHMLLLAGMLCLWASAYGLGRGNADERATPHGRAQPAAETGVRADLRGHAPDPLRPGIAVSGVGVDLTTSAGTTALKTATGGRTRGHGAPPSARPRAGSG